MKWIQRILVLFPLITLSSFYLLWGLAWIDFGYRPIPDSMLDPWCTAAPHEGLISPFWGVPMVMIFLMLGLAIYFVIYSLVLLFRRRAGWLVGLKRVGLFFLFLLIVLVMLKWDPGEVILWYFDP